jgi:hypothetical protein
VARKTTIAGTKVERGEKMRTGKGWRLIAPEPGNKAFKASLLKKFAVAGERLAIFRVLP